MRKCNKTSLGILKWLILLPLILLGINCSCAYETPSNSSNSHADTATAKQMTTRASNFPAKTKISPLLQVQVNLRREQLTNPTSERLAQMQAQGMKVSDLNIQRIFIYLNQNLTSTQSDDLQALGIVVYPDSWIPPVGNHPTGFILADMPIDALETLAAKDYVMKLDTAEVQSKPQT